MKQNILNEEIESMKYLFGYRRGKVISEQATIYYRGADGKVGTVQVPQAPPQGATTITPQEYQNALSGQPQPSVPGLTNFVNQSSLMPQPSTTTQQTNTGTTQTSATTQQTNTTQKKYSSLSDYVKEAQTLLGVTSDGKFGPKTLEALKSKLGVSGTQQTSTGTTQTSGATQPQACPAGQVYDETIKQCTLPAVTVTASKTGAGQQAAAGQQASTQQGAAQQGAAQQGAAQQGSSTYLAGEGEGANF